MKKIELLDHDDQTILSRIMYPDLEKANFFNQTKTQPSKVLTIGIASMARQEATKNYLIQTITKVLARLDVDHRNVVTLVVALTDKNKTLAKQRADELYQNFQEPIDSGLIKVISPPKVIYPLFKAKKGQRLPYGNSVKMSMWQSKLALDFAYLFSCSSQIQSDFFLNLEDDIEPSEDNFVNETIDFVEDQNKENSDWVSLIFSDYLSIGRLYRTVDLIKLVDLILIAYNKKPVDYIMHYFDVIQMDDRFREIRRKPSLFKHIGDISTKLAATGMEAGLREKMTLNMMKAKNPPATLSSNISNWQNYSLDHSYFPRDSQPLYFWGKQFKPFDVIDIRFKNAITMEAIQIETGFSSFELRKGEDRLTNGTLLLSKSQECQDFLEFPKVHLNPEKGRMDFSSRPLKASEMKLVENLTCIRLQVLEGQSDWLLVKLIHIKAMWCLKG